MNTGSMILIAGAAVTVGAVAAAAWAKRRGLPLRRGRFWRLLALGWAVVVVLGVILTLLPEAASSAAFAVIALVGGAGLLVLGLQERARPNPRSPLAKSSLNRAIVFGVLQLVIGVVLVLTLFGQH